MLTVVKITTFRILFREACPGAAHKGSACYAAPAGSSPAPRDGCAPGCLRVTRRHNKCMGSTLVLHLSACLYVSIIQERHLCFSPRALKRSPRPTWCIWHTVLALDLCCAGSGPVRGGALQGAANAYSLIPYN